MKACQDSEVLKLKQIFTVDTQKGEPMRLIVVTRHADGKKIYVNPELVCAVYPYYKREDKTVIQLSGAEENYLEVLESAESIANMIMGGEKED